MADQKWKVGQTVWLETIRGQGFGDVQEKVVEKVGPEYFYLSGMEARFFISNGKHDSMGFFSGWKVWADKSLLDASKERVRLLYKIDNASFTRLSLPQLREIDKIINP